MRRRRGHPYRSARRERGAALVEFALILPLFVMILLGLITGGFALSERQQMMHATREGARFGATLPADAENWASVVQSVVDDRWNGNLGSSDSVCVSLVRGSGSSLTVIKSTSGTSPCIPGQTASDGASTRVQVTASTKSEIQLGLFGTIDAPITTKATAKTEFEASS